MLIAENIQLCITVIVYWHGQRKIHEYERIISAVRVWREIPMESITFNRHKLRLCRITLELIWLLNMTVEWKLFEDGSSTWIDDR
jgi:hypothetical protein